ncbi:MAG: DUF4382 domain-containing protein [Bacteroidales bacterium]|nr:DUF4382 domain-containing protein [Bacteroidales bacterium]MDT8430160.1 DUF4382 domain-containing protein [Bacteroidales bacterium]
MKKVVLGIFIAILGAACSETDTKGDAVLKVHLTDAPAAYEEVLIDVVDVMYHLTSETDSGSWKSLEVVNAGVYNLLDFTNGLDTLLAEETLPTGTISQMRLVLGENNQVKKDGVYYDLKTPSAQTSGLKFLVNAELMAGLVYDLWIDFDAARSIVETGNGKFILKPVIRTYTESISGAIKGVVDPANSNAYVMSISADDDTVGTFADTISGKFLIGGLAAGMYDLYIQPAALDSVAVEDVEVSLGEVTQLDTIFLVND